LGLLVYDYTEPVATGKNGITSALEMPPSGRVWSVIPEHDGRSKLNFHFVFTF
jgi:hypothetical protein